MGNCHLQRRATDRLLLEAPVSILLRPRLQCYTPSIHEHREMRSCVHGISYVQSHGDVVTGNHQNHGRGGTLCRQRCPNLCTSKRVTHRWPTGRRSWVEIADMGGWLDAARSNCPCLRLDEAIGSRSAVIHAKEVRLPPRIILPAAHPSRRPTLIGFEAPIVVSADWRIYRHRAYDRFQLNSLPSLLFTSMHSLLRSLRHS
jgi:hypothetical protein